MKKNSHGIILRREPKEQHVSTIPKYYSYINFKKLNNHFSACETVRIK